MSKITVAKFIERLETLCSRQSAPGLPRKQQDRQILFKSVTLTLDPARTYAEVDLNQALSNWLANAGSMLEIDHVTLRRHMVDEGFLLRDSAGQAYMVNTAEAVAALFDPAINALDPVAVVEEAKERREERKRAYLEGG
jgi:hypothetical protein